MDTHRYMRPNRMQWRVLRELADVLARALSKLSLKCHSNCKRFLRTGRKQGELQFPSFKKAKKEYPGNHKQVSLTLIPPEHKKTLFHYHEDGLVLQQLAQRHYRVSIFGDTQQLDTISPSWSCLEQKSWSRWSSQSRILKPLFQISFLETYPKLCIYH